MGQQGDLACGPWELRIAWAATPPSPVCSRSERTRPPAEGTAAPGISARRAEPCQLFARGEEPEEGGKFPSLKVPSPRLAAVLRSRRRMGRCLNPCSATSWWVTFSKPLVPPGWASQVRKRPHPCFSRWSWSTTPALILPRAREGGNLPPRPRLHPLASPSAHCCCGCLVLDGRLTAQSTALEPDSLGPNPRSATLRLCDLRPVALPLPACFLLYKMGILAHYGGMGLWYEICAKSGTQ